MNREGINNIRQLSLALSCELLNIAHDLGTKALDSNLDTIRLIDALAFAIDTLRDDIGEFYQQRYDEFTEHFFKFESIA